MDQASEKYFSRPAVQIVKLMKEEKIDITRQRIKQLTPKILDHADKVVVLCKKDECPDFLTASNKNVLYHHIPDPYQFSSGSTRAIRNEIKHLVQLLWHDDDNP